MDTLKSKLASEPSLADERPAERSDSSRLPRIVDLSEHASFAPWRPSVRVRILLLVNVAAASFYAVWWLTPGHVGVPLLFGLLAAAEGFSLIHQLGLWWAMWATRVDPPPAPTRTYAIDVLIPTRGEPLDVLARTISAAVAMDLPHRTFVLDDAARPEVEHITRQIGAEYLARPVSRRGAKAGNLNYGLARTSGELFAIFDADHVPRRDFLRRIMGYFEDDSVAFVQTPQFYGNSGENEVARGAFQQQAIFYGPICRGKNGLASAFCCGTNVLFRRQAIDEVGGFDERSVVEDFVTSMRIHRRGWTSVYFPYVLAEGMGPSSLSTYFRQQFRWARGSVGALFSLEPFKPGFTLGQRVQYLLATTFYLIGVVTMIYVSLPILYLLLGWSAFSASSATFVFFYVPYLILALLTVRWGLGGQLRAEHLRYTFGSFPVYATASLAAVLHVPARFRVTGKAERTGRRRPPALVWITVLAFGLTAMSIAVGLLIRERGPRTFTNVSWAIVNLLLLWGIVRVAFREWLGGGRHADGSALPARTKSGMALYPVAGAQGVAVDDGGGVLVQHTTLVLPEHAVQPPGRRSRAWSGRHTGRLLIALTLLGLALRVALVDAQSLRLDESLSLLQVTKFSLPGLWRYLIQVNVHVPLYHTMLFFWVQLVGTSEWAIRIPSIVFGTAAIPLLFMVTRRIMGERAALFASAIGASSPFWTWHSDEARMYPMLLFFTLASMYLLFRALDKGGLGRWAAYALVTGLSLYVHYFALLMPPVHMAYLLINRLPRRKVLAWFGAMVAVGVMFLPWMVALYMLRIHESGLASLSNGVRLPPPSFTLFGIVYGLVFFFLVFLIGYGQAIGHGVGILGLLSAMVAGSWPLVALFGVTARRAGRTSRSRAYLFLLAWLVLTVGVVYAGTVWKPGLFLQRYLIAASPALFMLVAAGLVRVIRPKPVALALVFLSFASLAVTENFQVTNPVREDFRGAAAIIEQGYRHGDVVIVMPSFYDTPLQYYLKDEFPLISLLSSAMPPSAVVGTALPGIAEGHMGHSLWVLMPYESAFDPDRVIRGYMDRTLSRLARYRLGGDMELRRYLVPTLPQGT